MARNLLVVESPAKARTIAKYLGPDYEVMASYGHVRDLRPKEGAVEPDNGFRMHYEPIEKNSKHMTALSRAMKKADALYLATDPDREGEAISWHVLELLNDAKTMKDKPVHRVVFHEITKRAIQDAVAHPREISTDLVNAQQARRALDYLVGFNLSPLLWKKIRRGLSAGRVQSPALRMIVEREEEIERFVPREYWTLEADLDAAKTPFAARLTRLAGEKIEQFSLTSETDAERARETIEGKASGVLRVFSVEKKQRRRNPSAPFITSTLQQEAARKLGYGASRTMRIAQQLYEGVDTGSGATGLISYMRTDSTTLSADAVAEIREYIDEVYGKENVPKETRVFKTRAKNAQEAHEAIRPTSIRVTPASVASALSKDQLRLYELIWKRTLACQMQHALINTVAIDFTCGAELPPETPPLELLRATGSTVASSGFLAVYEEGSDDKAAEKESKLPPLEEGETVDLDAVRTDQHFTEPPPRYSEASLIRTLEEYGIGRPSTYASIISTLVNREYAELEKKRFQPTDVGRLVNAFLTEHFSDYVDFDFTARLEDDLDAVSRGERDWIPLMQKFWEPFNKQVNEKESSVSRRDASQARDLGVDPKSGRPVSVRMGRFGPYVQLGTAEDEEKPKFAGLRGEHKMNNITLEAALELFKLPRELGENEDGEPVSVNIGRFGPYVKYGSKYASLGKEDDPHTVELPRALEIVAEKKQADAAREIANFSEDGIRILRGRYGPYITNGEKNARVPKGREPEEISLEEAKTLLEAAPPPRPKGKRRKKAG